MYLVLITWIYIVILMAASEPTLLRGLLVFFGFAVVPLALLSWLTVFSRRRKRLMAEKDSSQQDRADS